MHFIDGVCIPEKGHEPLEDNDQKMIGVTLLC